MKIFKITIVFFVLIFLLSCQAVQDTREVIDLTNDAEFLYKTVYDESLYSSGYFMPEDMAAVFENEILFYNYNPAQKGFTLYNKKNNTKREVGDEYKCVVSSASYVIIDEAYYTSEVVVNNVGNEILRVIEVTSNGEFNVLKEYSRAKEVSPFVYFCRYDETKFMYTHSAGEKTYIEVYDVKSKTFSNFMMLEATEKDKKYLERVSVSDDKIYVVVCENNQYYLEIYNRDKILTQKMILDLPLFDISAMLRFNVVNNYLFFTNWNSEQAVYRLDKDEIIAINIDYLENVDKITDLTLYPYGLSSVYEEYTGLLYCTRDNHPSTGKNMDNRLYALNFDTGKIKSIGIEKSGNIPYLGGVICDEDGNILIMVKENKESEENEWYLLSNEFLKEVFNSIEN